METKIAELKKELSSLKTENKKLQADLTALRKGFSQKVPLDSFVKSIQTDLIKVDEFIAKQERPTTYVVSDLNMQLKSVVTRDGDRLTLALPSRPDEIDPNLMSTINLSLKPIPQVLSQIKKPPSAEDVEVIEGIGPEIGASLRTIGIRTVGDLAVSSVDALKGINISENRAMKFTGMAKLMIKSDLAGIAGVDEEAAELLVRGAKIDSKRKLAEANPEELLTKLKDAVEKREVRIPQRYKFTIDDVKKWIESAKQ